MLPEAASGDTELAAGTLLLRGQYDIDCPLANGGFGITYLARDSLNRKVVIKECFSQDHCKRRGTQVSALTQACAPKFERILEQFKREAFRLAALDHARVVGVHQVFEENGTAFLSMDHIDGDDLFTIADTQPDRLSATTLQRLLIEALDAIQYIHKQGLLHRDLAPDNFILDVDTHLTVIDFGSACDIVIKPEDENSKLLAVKDGYSPYEFYTNDVQDASSDLYSLAATFHYLITGYSPPDSQSRMAAVEAGQPDPFEPLAADDWNVDPALLDPINKGLALDRKSRLRSAAEWLAQIEEGQSALAPGVKPKPVVEPEPIIADEISRLVSSTNSALTPGVPGKLKQSAAAEAEAGEPAPEAAKPKQHFDIFGNPVHDVEAFLREQDKMPKKQKSKPELACPRQDTDAVREERKTDSHSVVGRMLDKMRSGKRSLTSAIPQN